MKRLFGFMLAAVVCFSLVIAGCGMENEPMRTPKQSQQLPQENFPQASASQEVPQVTGGIFPQMTDDGALLMTPAPLDRSAIEQEVQRVNGITDAAVAVSGTTVIVAVKKDKDRLWNSIVTDVEAAVKRKAHTSVSVHITDDDGLFGEIRDTASEAVSTVEEKLDGWIARING